MNMINGIKEIFFTSDNRTKKVSKNAKIILFVKISSVFCSMFLMRVMYDFLNNKGIYGIWLTILSILSWINIFDIGIGNGLRNILTKMLAKDDFENARKYVSTAYFIFLTFISLLILIFCIFSSTVQWNYFFNTNLITQENLNLIMKVIIILYLIQFFLNLINYVAYAYQDAVVASVTNLISNALILIELIILTKTTFRGLLIVSIVYSGSFCIVLIFTNFYLFTQRYKKIVPNINQVTIEYLPDLFNVGLKFFIIQIAGVIIFTTDNIIISHLFGPEYVTPYQVTYKLFNIFIIGFSIIQAPLWSAYTDAYTKRDYNWLNKTLTKVKLLNIPFAIGIILMIITAKTIIKYWMGEELNVPTILILLMGFYTILYILNNSITTFLNGVNKLNYQLIYSIISAIINIPVSIFLAKKIGMGISGVILGTIVSNIGFPIIGILQIKKVIKKMDFQNNSLEGG